MLAIQLAAALALLGAGNAAQAAAPTDPAAAPTTSAAGGPSTPQATPGAPSAPSGAPASSAGGAPQPVQPPPALAPLRVTGPTSVIAGRPVRFAAVRPPGTTLEFRWDFGGSGSGASNAASSAAGRTLPNTGFDARTGVIAGLAMLVLGIALLGAARRRPPRAGSPRD